MVGAFSVIPFISTAFVSNVGVTERQLPAVFIAGGLLTLVTAPLAGRLVDRHGALAVFRCIVPVTAVMMVVVTNLPAVGIAVAAPVAVVLMAANASRMVTAMSLIMSSIEPRYRGGFISANSAVQHIASGLGTMLGGLVVAGGTGEPLRNFGTVGIATMTDRLLAGVLQPAFAWALSLGLIGLFSRYCSRPSPQVSWLADASYWMYLVHPPLVMVAQMVVRPWAMPADLKVLVVMALVTPVLIPSYRYGVRDTVIGSLLNGPRGPGGGPTIPPLRPR